MKKTITICKGRITTGKKITFTNTELNIIFWIMSKEQHIFKLNHEGHESKVIKSIIKKVC